MVGAPVTCSLISGPDDEVVSDDDLPGRRFWRWRDESLIDLFTGAGFERVSLSGETPRFVDAVRARTLPDFVAPGMQVLGIGLGESKSFATYTQAVGARGQQGLAVLHGQQRWWAGAAARIAVAATVSERARAPSRPSSRRGSPGTSCGRAAGSAGGR